MANDKMTAKRRAGKDVSATALATHTLNALVPVTTPTATAKVPAADRKVTRKDNQPTSDRRPKAEGDRFVARALTEDDTADKSSRLAIQFMAAGLMIEHSYWVAASVGTSDTVASLAQILKPGSAEAKADLLRRAREVVFGPNGKPPTAKEASADGGIGIEAREAAMIIYTRRNRLVERGLELAAVCDSLGLSIYSFDDKTGMWLVPYGKLPDPDDRKHVRPELAKKIVPLDGTGYGAAYTDDEGKIKIISFAASATRLVDANKPVRPGAKRKPQQQGNKQGNKTPGDGSKIAGDLNDAVKHLVSLLFTDDKTKSEPFTLDMFGDTAEARNAMLNMYARAGQELTRIAFSFDKTSADADKDAKAA